MCLWQMWYHVWNNVHIRSKFKTRHAGVNEVYARMAVSQVLGALLPLEGPGYASEGLADAATMRLNVAEGIAQGERRNVRSSILSAEDTSEEERDEYVCLERNVEMDAMRTETGEGAEVDWTEPLVEVGGIGDDFDEVNGGSESS